MLPDISIEFFQYDPQLTTNILIYGRLISSDEASAELSVQSFTAPGNATYCSILVQKDLHLEVSNETPTVVKGRRFPMPCGERRGFQLGPQESSTIKIGYKLA